MGGTRSNGTTRAPSSTQSLYGIRRIVWYAESQGRPDDLDEDVRALEEVSRLVPPSALEGLHELSITDGGFLWARSVYQPPYSPEDVQRYGPGGDKIILDRLQLREKGRVPVMLEEVAHRMHTVSHKPLYAQFKRERLGTYARSLGLVDTHFEGTSRSRSETMASESFAKSFVLFKTGQASSLPAPVREFWERSGL